MPVTTDPPDLSNRPTLNYDHIKKCPLISLARHWLVVLGRKGAEKQLLLQPHNCTSGSGTNRKSPQPLCMAPAQSAWPCCYTSALPCLTQLLCQAQSHHLRTDQLDTNRMGSTHLKGPGCPVTWSYPPSEHIMLLPLILQVSFQLLA